MEAGAKEKGPQVTHPATPAPPCCDCELQVSSDPGALWPEQEGLMRSHFCDEEDFWSWRSPWWGVAGGHSTQVGRLGPRERSSGIMVREMASASWSKVKRCDGDDVPLNREKNAPPALRPNSWASLTCSWQSRDGAVCDVTEPGNQGMLGTEEFGLMVSAGRAKGVCWSSL